MSWSITLALFFLAFFSGFARAETKSAKGSAVFYGVVQAVDLANKTFTIQAQGRSYLFHYDEQTKISREGGYIRWETVKAGLGAAVLMRVGEGNVGFAVQVRFMNDNGRAEGTKLWVARTIKGETISGPAVENYVLSEPAPFSFSGGAGYGLTGKYGSRSGVFHLTVRPDGSVAEVTVAKSLGDDKMNLRMAAWLKKWKFRPNSLSEVQIPMSFQWSSL
ncbi:MAG: hypothetical protein ABIR29_11925 [Chthoniobacterales bacterium]